MKEVLRKSVGVFLFLLGIFILMSSQSGMTGNVVSERTDAVSSIISLVMILGGLGMMSVGTLEKKVVSGRKKSVRLSKEDRESFGNLVIKEIEKHKKEEIEKLTTNQELMDLFGISRTSIGNNLRLLDNELRKYRSKELSSYNLKNLHEDPEFAKRTIERGKKHAKRLQSDPDFVKENLKRLKKFRADPIIKKKREKGSRETMKKLNANPNFRAKKLEALKKRNADPNFRAKHLEVMRKLHSNPKFTEKIRKTSSENMKRLHADPEFAKRTRERGIKRVEDLRKKAYNVENRFYTMSQQEGAVALLLEKYVPNFKISKEENYQVGGGNLNVGGIDFLVGKEFLEWHPINLSIESKKHLSDQEMELYKERLESANKEKGKRLRKGYEKVFGKRYQLGRQSAIDTSDYSEHNLTHAENVEELYDFMSRHSDNLPAFDDFKREFNKNVKYVKGFKVDEKKKK